MLDAWLRQPPVPKALGVLPQDKKIACTLTVEARQAFVRWLAKQEPGSVLCLLKARKDNERKESWLYSSYEPKQVAHYEAVERKDDLSLFYDIDGFRVVIMPPNKVLELQHTKLGIDNDRLVISKSDT